jgi:squalene-hopene/tetraprenyl-beta-curcumene cyclase
MKFDMNEPLRGLGASASHAEMDGSRRRDDRGVATLVSLARLLTESARDGAPARPAAKRAPVFVPSAPDPLGLVRRADGRPGPLPSPLLEAASQARERLLLHLVSRIDFDGAIRDQCGSRILESALLLRLLQKEGANEPAQAQLAAYLEQAEPDDELSALIADAALGRGSPQRASQYLASFSHDTGSRKSLLLRTLLALFGLVPFVDLMGAQPIHYMGFASWTEVTLCAIKLLRAHALRMNEPAAELEADRAFLASRLASAGPGRVYEGNLLAHLIALFALQTRGPGEPLLHDGTAAMLRHQRSDGGVPFITGQEIWVTALAGAALAGTGGDRTFLIPMADKVASWQLPDGGWAYSEDARQSDVDDASRCVDFLSTVDPVRYAETIRRGRDYLVGMADPKTGGFPTYVRGHASDVDVTAGSVIALLPFWDEHAALLDGSVELLLDEQDPDGTFPLAWTLSNCSVIGHVLEALRRVPQRPSSVAQRIARAAQAGVQYIHTAQGSDGGWGQQPGQPSDVLSTAHAIPPLANHGIPHALHRGVSSLLSHQQPDGGFSSPPDQVGPRPLAYDFPILADVHTLNALNSVLPPIAMPAGLSMPAVPARASARPSHGGSRDDDSKPVTVPALYCPIPAAIHPSVDELQERSNEWLDRFSLYNSETQRNRLKHGGSGMLAARMCPNGREELLQVKSDFNMWVIAFDDEYCDEGLLSDRPGELIEAVCRMHRTAEITEMIMDERERYGLAMRDLRMRLDALASPEDGARFLETVRAFMMGEVRKVGYVARRQRPGIDDYTAVRLYMGGAMVSPIFTATVNGVRLPVAHLANRRVRALTEMAAFLTTWAPDLFSAGKDDARSPDGFSPTEAIQRDKALRTGNPGTRADAQAEAAALWERVMMLYLRLRDRVLAGAPADLAGYVKGLDPYIRGSLDWCRETSRYRYQNGVDGPEIMQPGELHSTPPNHTKEPIPIPAIAWWWIAAGETDGKQSR